MIFLVPPVLAVLFLMRGKHHDWLGTQGSRILFWAGPFGMLLFSIFPVYYSAPWQLAYLIGLVFSLWLGLVLAKYSKYWFMKSKQDYIMMGLNGIIITLPAGLLLAISSWCAVVFVFSGVLMAPAYAIGWKLPALASWLNKGTQWGELLTGLFIGLYASVLWSLLYAI